MFIWMWKKIINKDISNYSIQSRLVKRSHAENEENRIDYLKEVNKRESKNVQTKLNLDKDSNSGHQTVYNEIGNKILLIQWMKEVHFMCECLCF